jgi:hypothetical protein
VSHRIHGSQEIIINTPDPGRAPEKSIELISYYILYSIYVKERKRKRKRRRRQRDECWDRQYDPGIRA